MLTTKPRGTNDFLADTVRKWQYLEEVIRKVCREYGYGEIRTPIFEHTELFQRGVGDTTDIVEKEMYTFTDRGDRSLTLRPEGTASAVRAFIENKLSTQAQPTKLYYIGPMFRYDRPQAGRYRQFHQFGVEVFGSNDPAVDAEVITMLMDLYGRLGLKDLELHINSVGCPKCREEHRKVLQEFLGDKVSGLCKNCQGRFERNPMRILDCKNEACQGLTKGAPTTGQCLCPECDEHFAKVKDYLDLLGIEYKVNDRLVRGLDYYTNTAFEVMARGIGAQSSIGGGGRYNGLIEQVGGGPVPGIGWAMGLERAILTMEQQGIKFPEEPPFDVFIATIGEEAAGPELVLLTKLRKAGLAAEKDYLGRSLKAQMKYAGKFNAKFTLIMGGDELQRGVVVVRDMAAGTQEEVALDRVVDTLVASFINR
ncbi:MAG: histidine--tRNA ligase [Clostridia bacterium]|nr:histidine--tRNA ligase [Clostridia bacterium]